MSPRRIVVAIVLAAAALGAFVLVGVELPFAVAWAMVVAALVLLSGLAVPDAPASDAPLHDTDARRRSSEISRMAWSFNPRTGAAGQMVTRRVRAVLRRRLARHGLDADDPVQQTRVDAVIGAGVWSALNSGRTGRVDLERALDAIDRLEQPFHVIATSNPIEYEGTYALPEAQLDRFMVRLSVGYQDAQRETDILLGRVRRRSETAIVDPVISSAELLELQSAVESIHVEEDVARYCVDLARATRAAQHVAVGASPRGSQSLLLLGRALAALGGRDYVLPDDIKRVAVPVLAHRLTLTPQAWAQGVLSSDIVRAVVSQVAVPPTVGAAR